jgi:maltose alpha-D-glucosyltransferase/alpha-amylase
MRINLGIRRRLAPLLQNDRRKIELLNALLFSLPGTPIIYYGDEIGMGDNVYLGDRDGVRTPMQWSADRNAGFSQANPQRLYLPVIIDPEYHFETVNVEAQRSNPSSMWWWMHRLIALRTRNNVFGRGDLRFLDPENSKVLAFIRSPHDGEEGDEILVVANLSRYAQAVELDLSDHVGSTPVELFGHTAFARVGQLPYYLTLAPYGFYWFRLDPRPAQGDRSTPAELPLVSLTDSGSVAAGRARASVERALATWLPTRRWFAGKSRLVRSVSITDVVNLDDRRSSPTQLVFVSVDYTEGDPEAYCVPLAVQRVTEDGMDESRAGDVIARVKRRQDRDEVLVDAFADPTTAANLTRIAVRQLARKGAKGELSGWSAPEFRKVAKSNELPPTVSGAEQSNSSVMLGDEAIVKLYRRLDEGTSPELEIGQHLRQIGFDRGASLLGSVTYQRPRADPTTVAVFHQLVPNEGDAWRYALDQLNGYYERVLARADEPEAALVLADSLSTEPVDPPSEVWDIMGVSLSAADLIGRRTAEMHIALCTGDSPAFTPEPFTTLYQRSLYQSVLGEARGTLRLLRSNRSSLSDELCALIDALPQDRMYARLDAVRTRKIETVRTRLHGDYHLGQVLWTGRDFVIIDFEGEPSRSVGQRRLKRSPLRDVAGMMRSFHYAASVGLREQVERGSFASLAAAELRLGRWCRFWVDWMSARYIAGYLEACSGEPFVPADTSDLRLLLDLFLLEKCCYEVRYELNHRPDWVDIPLRAISDLVGVFPETEESAR